MCPRCGTSAHSREIAEWLYPKLQAWWTETPPVIPASWRDAWLVWLSKPSKPPTTASNLRAIALQEPIGKQVLSILIEHSLHHAFPTLRTLPQMAYLPGRGTMEAIARTRAHCSLVRQHLEGSHRDVHLKASGAPLPKFHGGVQVFIDLQRAFDSVDRAFLFNQLARMNIPGPLCGLLKSWHVHSHYYMESYGQSTKQPISTGVRQGCKGAPLLWCIVIALVMQDLGTVLTDAWIKQCVTMFADDLHVCAIINSLADLRTFVTNVATIIEKLASIGLNISPTKSTALILIRGKHHGKLNREFLHQTSEGWNLKIPLSQRVLLIPVKSSCRYLGVVLSYKQFEMETIAFRIRSAWISFHRLHRWLLNKRIRLCARYRLWLTSIFPVMTYGL